MRFTLSYGLEKVSKTIAINVTLNFDSAFNESRFRDKGEPNMKYKISVGYFDNLFIWTFKSQFGVQIITS